MALSEEELEKLKIELAENVIITKGELLQLIGLSRAAANRLYDGKDKDRLNSELQTISDKYFKIK